MEYDKNMSRPLRTTILFIGSLVSLAATFNLSAELSLNQILLVVFISPVVSITYSLCVEKCYYSNKAYLNRLATFLILLTAAILWYGVLNVAIPTDSYQKTNNWAILYSISMLSDNLLFQFFIVIVKYDISRRVVRGSDNLALKLARLIFLK